MRARLVTIDLGEREQEPAGQRRFPVSVSSESPVVRRDPYTGEPIEEVLSPRPGR